MTESRRTWERMAGRVSPSMGTQGPLPTSRSHSPKTDAIQSLISAGKYEAARGEVEALLTAEPQSADGHYFAGVIAYFQNQLRPAIESLRRALELDPRHTDAAICLSVLMNDLGRYADAKQVFEQANQSVAIKRLGEVDEADKKFAVKHLELADLYFRYRRYDEAIEEYGKAALLDPETLDIRIRRAKAFAKKGFVTRAIQELQQLKGERPRSLPVRIQLGLLHYSQGNVLDAELEWEAVLEQEPEHREAKAYLEMAKRDRV